MNELQYALIQTKALEFLVYAIVTTLFVGVILLFKFRNK